MDAIAVCDFKERHPRNLYKEQHNEIRGGLINRYLLNLYSGKVGSFAWNGIVGVASEHTLVYFSAGGIFDGQCTGFYKCLSACQMGSSLAATFLPGTELLQYSWTLLLPFLLRNPHVFLVRHDVR